MINWIGIRYSVKCFTHSSSQCTTSPEKNIMKKQIRTRTIQLKKKEPKKPPSERTKRIKATTTTINNIGDGRKKNPQVTWGQSNIFRRYVWRSTIRYFCNGTMVCVASLALVLLYLYCICLFLLYLSRSLHFIYLKCFRLYNNEWLNGSFPQIEQYYIYVYCIHFRPKKQPRPGEKEHNAPLTVGSTKIYFIYR